MFTFTVRPDGRDEFEVKAGTRDVVFWEKTTKGASLSTLQEGLRLTDLYKIAWIAAKRQSLFAGSLDEFETTCELEFEEEEQPDPTRPAR